MTKGFDFTAVLERAEQEPPNLNEALLLMRESAAPEKGLRLFASACRIRDRALGRRFHWSAGISGVLSCQIVPRCRYCTYAHSTDLPLDDLQAAAAMVEAAGIHELHLSGGANLAGYESEALRLVEAVRARTSANLELNLGPSLPSLAVLEMLRELGVTSVTSSLEVANPSIFARVKPADSLQAREELLERADEAGLKLRSMMLVGLGESPEDRVRHLFYFKRFRHFANLRVSRFFPYRGTAMRDHPRASPWDVARVVAIARLVFPQIDIGLAAGNGLDDLPLWVAAGGGNQMLGMHASRRAADTPPGARVYPVGSLYMEDKRAAVAGFLRGLGVELPAVIEVGRRAEEPAGVRAGEPAVADGDVPTDLTAAGC